MKIFSWANTDFLFEKKLAKHFYDIEKFKVDHDKDWFTSKKSYLKEFRHIGRLIKQILSIEADVPIVLFGTNLCRILYPFIYRRINVFFVFNELPCLDQNKLLFLFDRKIFRSKNSQVFVSSKERSELCCRNYNCESIKVLPNIPVFKHREVSSKKLNHLVYAGLINRSRFNSDAINMLKNLKIEFHLLGKVIDEGLLAEIDSHQYLGEKTFTESQYLQSQYRYALLSYGTTDLNNDYCAPIKIFEYIYSGCVCITINKNVGLQRYLKLYPNLFITLSEFTEYQYNEEKYQNEKEIFFKNEMDVLTQAINDILKQSL
ncbi:hypothetical protein H4J38_01305 [Colwellia sp. BRX10-3]|uniref:hypothetical protein n=1 Tax=Colwellia sp. BRX10-3 TaxID=2759844 RepID=UPI0015F3B639|nr:hypothetical protein [Colwellia sp. BRX10-3]MBA6389409.1 hypothetical protein [Colwellia sp. BRX10-3]|tara:strand:+ start:72 stop:1022 length:951 start_codon:yes stop_codon:yes gene_type:complete